MIADKLRSVPQQVAPPSADFSYVGFTSANVGTAATTITIDKPAGVAVGDLLVAIVTPGGGVGTTLTSPGWTTRVSSNSRFALTKVVAVGDGASYTFTLDVSTTMAGSILAFQNAEFHIAGTVSPNATPTVAPSITTTKPVFVIDYMGSNSGFTVTTPAGWIPLVTDTVAPDTEAIGKFFPTGATGAVSVTTSTSVRSVLIAVASTGTIAARFVAAAHVTTPFVSVYPFLENAGFGQRMASPATVPGGTGNGVAFTSSGDAIAVAHNTSGISAYPWSINGFGTRFADPGTLPSGTGFSVAFNEAEDAIVVGHGSTPFVSAYAWSTSGFGTRYVPAVSPAGSGNGVAFSSDGAYIAVAHTNLTCLSVYPWAAGFGTKITPTGTTLNSPCYSAAFAPNNSALAVSGNVTPYLAAYPWSGSFGTRYPDPATGPTGGTYTVAFSPSGSLIAAAHSTAPFISVYDWSSGFGSKYSDPTTAPSTSNCKGVVFSDTEDTIFMGSSSSPYINAYKWVSGFGDKYANPPTLPPAAVLSVAFCKIAL